MVLPCLDLQGQPDRDQLPERGGRCGQNIHRYTLYLILRSDPDPEHSDLAKV